MPSDAAPSLLRASPRWLALVACVSTLALLSLGCTRDSGAGARSTPSPSIPRTSTPPATATSAVLCEFARRSPVPGDTVARAAPRFVLGAEIRCEGGIASARMTVDQVPVRQQDFRNLDMLSILGTIPREDLADGPHLVEILVVPNGRSAFTEQWNFTVVTP